MDSSEHHAGKINPRRELQGPRPTPLRIRKDSHMIKKPPLARPPAAAGILSLPPAQHRHPVIIYTVSPKVIHTEASDFMTLVQRLTGCSSSSSLSSSEALSPAAHLAATIKKSGSLDQVSPITNDFGIFNRVEIETAGLDRTGSFHGILSPIPSALPPMTPSIFLPSPDPSSVSLFQELSPAIFGSRNYVEGGLFPSPSAFLSAPIPSPNLSLDFLNQLFDF